MEQTVKDKSSELFIDHPTLFTLVALPIELLVYIFSFVTSTREGSATKRKCHHSTRSSSINKLEHVFISSNQQRNFYFNRLPRTFNSLPVIDLTQPFVTIKFQLTKIIWQHFMRNFDPDNQYSFHFTCPCSICSKHPKPPNFDTFSS